MRRSLLMATLCFSFAAQGCGSESEDPPNEPAEEPSQPDETVQAGEGEGVAVGDPEETEAEPEAAAPEAPPAEPGTIPGIDFPAVPTTAVAEQAVFVPVPGALTSLAGNTENPVSGIGWQAAVMVTPGEVESQVRRGFGDPYTCPNSLIIPIEPNPEARAGTLIVSGSPGRFTVERVLSVADNGNATVSSIWGGSPRAATRNAGRWWVPTAAGAPATYLHCVKPIVDGLPADQEETDRYIMLRASGEQNLVMTASASSAITVLPAATCTPIPFDTGARVGSTILATHRGHVREMTVRSIDRATGVFTAHYDFLGTDTEATFLPGGFMVP